MAGPARATDARRRSTPLTVAAGLVAGVGAYLLGYVVTYVLTSDPVRNSFAQRLVQFVTGEPATWKMVGWVFYSAHFVDTIVPGLFGSRAVNLVEAIDAISVVVYLVPPVVLLATGAVLARWAGATGIRAGATAGASVVFGYFPLAVVGAFLFVVAVGDAVARPDVVSATFIAGLAYPLAFGAIGGVAGATGRGRPSRPNA